MSSTLTPQRAVLSSSVPSLPGPALSVPGARRLAFAGGAWALGFAAFHGYWAAGGRLGVPADVAPIGQRAGFLAYDVAAGVVLAAAGVIGLLLATPTGGGRRRLFLVHLALVGAVAALLRGGLGLLSDLTTAATGGGVTAVGVLSDVWFTVAGVVFFVAARRLRPTARVVSASRR